jgi:hypothetical protein
MNNLRFVSMALAVTVSSGVFAQSNKAEMARLNAELKALQQEGLTELIELCKQNARLAATYHNAKMELREDRGWRFHAYASPRSNFLDKKVRDFVWDNSTTLETAKGVAYTLCMEIMDPSKPLPR